MNKAYKVVFNETTGTYVAVAEIVSARGKASSTQENTTTITAVPQSVTGRFMGKVIMALLGLTTALAMPLAHASYVAGGGTVGTNNNNTIAIGSIGTGNSGTTQGSAATVTSGFGGVAIGGGANVYGNYAIALGASSKALYENAIAIGYNNTASGQSSVTIGSGSAATGKGALALGNDAKATADNATAVGAGNHDSTGALASASGASAFGYLAKAQGSNSTAVGANSLATAANTIAIGGDSTASGAQAIAIGNLSVANSVNSIALGNGAQQIYSGGLNTATSNSIAIGHLATNGNRSSMICPQVDGHLLNIK